MGGIAPGRQGYALPADLLHPQVRQCDQCLKNVVFVFSNDLAPFGEREARRHLPPDHGVARQHLQPIGRPRGAARLEHDEFPPLKLLLQLPGSGAKEERPAGPPLAAGEDKPPQRRVAHEGLGRVRAGCLVHLGRQGNVQSISARVSRVRGCDANAYLLRGGDAPQDCLAKRQRIAAARKETGLPRQPRR